MPVLLHLDVSARREGSHSRRLGDEFARHWRSANPDGEIIHRDLAADPLPYVDEAEAVHFLYTFGQGGDRTAPTVALAHELIRELKSADLLLIATPMYNFTVPATLKSWMDHVVWPNQTFDPQAGVGLLGHLRATVIASRSGGYGPGTPREDFNHQDPLLRRTLGLMGISDITVVPAELTAFAGPQGFPSPPDGPDLRALAEQSLADAESRILELARVGATRDSSVPTW